jgi:hypothetical protein
MGITVERGHISVYIYKAVDITLDQWSNPGSSAEMLDFLRVQTLDRLRIIPWITGDRPAGKLTHSFPTFDKTQMWVGGLRGLSTDGM